uniref:Bifunctional inhibitor/plant lipid transfer protein/seed storage helical domain-containing protein n=2 Tax=Oryza TaxID=4527 RepID=A0A0D3GVW4_9ORYZ
MMKIAGVVILVLVICPTITSATETRGGRDDDLSDDKIWTSLIAFVGRYMLTHYPGLVVPPICIEDIAKKCGWNNLTPACVMEEMDSCH